MHGEGFFLQAFVYLTAAVVSVPIAQASRPGLGARLPDRRRRHRSLMSSSLVGEEGQDVMHFAEFGVVMMLFVVGLELRPSAAQAHAPARCVGPRRIAGHGITAVADRGP